MDSIKEIRRWAATISENWDGKEPGLQEDMALTALELIDVIEEMEDYIGQLEEMDNFSELMEDEARGYE
jgi:hypothetical protein